MRLDRLGDRVMVIYLELGLFCPGIWNVAVSPYKTTAPKTVDGYVNNMIACLRLEVAATTKR